jgi:tetratricopeptide (TPR) repeat protein
VVGTISLLLAAVLAAASLRKDQSHAPQSTLAGLAKNKYVLGHYEDAIRIYEELLREFPATDMAGDYHQMLGNAHFHLQDWTRAESCYRLAAAERPDFPQPLWNLAQALHRQGRSDEALATLDRLGREFSAKHPGFVRKVADARTVILQQNQARAAHPRIPALPAVAP